MGNKHPQAQCSSSRSSSSSGDDDGGEEQSSPLKIIEKLSPFKEFIITHDLRQVTIFTDLRPEGFISLFLFLTHPAVRDSHIQINIVVSEWRDPQKKADLLIPFLDALYLNSNSINIYVGESSEKDFGYPASLTAMVKRESPRPKWHGDLLFRAMVLCLMSPRELFKEIDNPFLSESILFLYGGTNITTMLAAKEASLDRLSSLFHRFNMTIYYHCGREDGAVSKPSASYLKNWSFLCAIIHSWNEHLLKCCEAELGKDAFDSPKMVCLYRMYDELANERRLFMMAEPGLILYLLSDCDAFMGATLTPSFFSFDEILQSVTFRQTYDSSKILLVAFENEIEALIVQQTLLARAFKNHTFINKT